MTAISMLPRQPHHDPNPHFEIIFPHTPPVQQRHTPKSFPSLHQLRRNQHPWTPRQSLQALDPNKPHRHLLTPTGLFSLHKTTKDCNIYKMAVITNAVRATSLRFENPDATYLPGGSAYNDSDGESTDRDDTWTPATPEQTPKHKTWARAKMTTTSTAKAKTKSTPMSTTTPLTPTKQKAMPKQQRKKRNSDIYSTFSDSSASSGGSRRSHGAPDSSYRPVIDGRVVKNYQSRSARTSRFVAAAAAAAAEGSKRLGTSEIMDELVSELNRGNQLDQAQCEIDMALEKGLYPGSEQWAEDEERLFETLFMRQYRPILPQSWTFDFRGIPAPDAIFGSKPADMPLIYSCSGDDYSASKALIRLISLTGSVRALVQSGVKSKAAAMIRAGLFRYAKWAAKDGGFGRHAVIPTFLLEVIDTSLSGADITRHIKARMAELAAEHRDFLRRGGDDDDDDVVSGAASDDPLPQQYRRRPPVIYGLFIVHTVVLVLTVDSAKAAPDEAQVSYHVEVNFNSPYQGVWNALTVAIPVCMARDDLRSRLADFPVLGHAEESDPDA